MQKKAQIIRSTKRGSPQIQTEYPQFLAAPTPSGHPHALPPAWHGYPDYFAWLLWCDICLCDSSSLLCGVVGLVFSFLCRIPLGEIQLIYLFYPGRTFGSFRAWG